MRSSAPVPRFLQVLCGLALCASLTLHLGCSARQALTSAEDVASADAEVLVSTDAGAVARAKESTPRRPVPGSALDRLVISSAELRLETPSPDSVHRAVMSLSLRLGGYVVSSSEERTTIRIPAADFDAALTELSALGRTLSRKVAGQDVTEAYQDLALRIDNAERARERLLTMLQGASGLDATLRLEKEIRRLTTEIELLRGRLEQLEHELKFATLTVETELEPEPDEGGPGFVVAGVVAVGKGIARLFWRW